MPQYAFNEAAKKTYSLENGKWNEIPTAYDESANKFYHLVDNKWVGTDELSSKPAQQSIGGTPEQLANPQGGNEPAPAPSNIGSAKDLAMYPEGLYQSLNRTVIGTPLRASRAFSTLEEKITPDWLPYSKERQQAQQAVHEELSLDIQANEAALREREERLKGFGIDPESNIGEVSKFIGGAQGALTVMAVAGPMTKPFLTSQAVAESVDTNLERGDVSTPMALARGAAEGLLTYGLLSLPGGDKVKTAAMAKGAGSAWQALNSEAPTLYKSAASLVASKLARGVTIGTALSLAERLLDKAFVDHKLDWVPGKDELKRSVLEMIAWEAFNGLTEGRKHILKQRGEGAKANAAQVTPTTQGELTNAIPSEAQAPSEPASPGAVRPLEAINADIAEARTSGNPAKIRDLMAERKTALSKPEATTPETTPVAAGEPGDWFKDIESKREAMASEPNAPAVEPGQAPSHDVIKESAIKDREAAKMVNPVDTKTDDGFSFKSGEGDQAATIKGKTKGGGYLDINIHPQDGVAVFQYIALGAKERGKGKAEVFNKRGAEAVLQANPDIKWIGLEASSKGADKVMKSYPTAIQRGSEFLIPIQDVIAGGGTAAKAPRAPKAPVAAPGQPASILEGAASTGGLGTKKSPIGGDYIEYLNGGLNVQHAFADVLGMERGSSWSEMAPVAMEKIGRLGASARETAIRIMNKIKGVSREVADRLAEHLHKFVSGSREGQLGAIGPKVEVPQSMESRYPEEYKTWREDARSQREAIKGLIPEDTAEARAERDKLYSAIEPFREPEAKPVNLQHESAREVASTLGLAKITRDLQDAFGDHVGPKGESTKESIRELGAREAYSNAVRGYFLEDIRNVFDKLPEAEQHEIIDAKESGSKTGDPKWDKLIDWSKQQSDDLYKRMKDVGINDVGYLENYLSLMAKDPTKIDEYVNKMKKSMAGGTGFLKSRHIANYETLRELGIEPRYTNIADIMMANMAGEEQLIKAKSILNAEVRSGRVVATTGEAPEGMVPLNENITRKIGDRSVKPDGKPGAMFKYYADPGTATVMDNYTSQGFESMPKVKNIYKFARTAALASVAAELSLSGYHYLMGGAVAHASSVGLGVSDMQQGDIGKGLYKILKGVTPLWSAVDTFRDGRTLRKAMLEGNVPKEMMPIADAILKSGMRLTNSEHRIDRMHTNALHSFRDAMKSFQNGDEWRAFQQATAGALKAPLNLAEYINKPLMDHLIPNMKIGVIAQMAAYEMAHGDPETLRARLQKAGQAVEDRLGQMTYDNLFWHKVATQALMLGTRSVGWNYGSYNTVKGMTDAAKTVGQLFKGNVQATTHRTNFIIGTMVVTAINGMLIQYFMGQGHPKPLKDPKDEFIPGFPLSTDMFAPRTGGTDRYGRPKRAMTAGYMKDWAEYVRMAGGRANLADFVKSKLNPAISGAWGAVTNKDTMGNEIGDMPARLASMIPVPISAKQVMQGRESGKSWPMALAPSMGFPEAKRDLISTHAENVLREKLAARGGGSTEEEVSERTKMGRFAEAVHAGHPEIVENAVKSKEISPVQAGQIRRSARTKPFLATNIKNPKLKFDDVYSVYEAASPEERRAIKGSLFAAYTREFPTANPSRQAAMRALRGKIK